MEKLVVLINRQDRMLKNVFTNGFQTPTAWYDYLSKHFDLKSRQPVTALLNGSMEAADFQALFVACWIHQPVEKGTYMIELASGQRPRVKAGYKRLGLLKSRPSSHLKKMGKSAGTGFQFLKNYNELLVQMEGGGANDGHFMPNLLLKAEGHKFYTLAHIQSWVHKARTGQGETANQALNRVAEAGMIDGIRARAAENYNNSYKALLKVLGLKGKMQTVRSVAVAMYNKLVELGERERLVALGRRYRLGTGPELADALEYMLLPLVGELPLANPLRVAVNRAMPDFNTIIADLRADQGMSERFFAEVKVTPRQLDSTLMDFVEDLVVGGPSPLPSARRIAGVG